MSTIRTQDLRTVDIEVSLADLVAQANASQSPVVVELARVEYSEPCDIEVVAQRDGNALLPAASTDSYPLALVDVVYGSERTQGSDGQNFFGLKGIPVGRGNWWHVVSRWCRVVLTIIPQGPFPAGYSEKLRVFVGRGRPSPIEYPNIITNVINDGLAPFPASLPSFSVRIPPFMRQVGIPNQALDFGGNPSGYPWQIVIFNEGRGNLYRQILIDFPFGNLGEVTIPLYDNDTHIGMYRPTILVGPSIQVPVFFRGFR